MQTNRLSGTRCGMAIVFWLFAVIGQAGAEDFVVKSAADSGPDTLRWAIGRVNAVEASQHRILFGEGITEIGITSPLPSIIRPVQILGGGDVIIDGGGGSGNAFVFAITTGTNFCRVYDITIQNFSGSGVVINTTQSEFVEVDHATINDNGVNGIIAQSSKHAHIHDCVIMGNINYGVYVDNGAKKVEVLGNQVYLNYEGGFYLGDYARGTDKAEVGENFIGWNGFLGGKGGVQIWSPGNNVYDNHIFENFDPGVRIGFGDENFVNRNNIFFNSGKGIDNTYAFGQTKPLLTPFVIDEQQGTVTIPFELDATDSPNTLFLFDFYVSDAQGEGAAWLGQKTVNVIGPGVIIIDEATVGWDYEILYPDYISGHVEEDDLIVATATSYLQAQRGTSEFSEEVPIAAEVVGRHVFYNNSKWDDPNQNRDDDDAIAPDKQALLSGQTAGFANYSTYSRGINGIMVDVANLAGTPTVDDFVFKIGNDNDPSGWDTLSATPTISVRQGEGADNSDRVTLIWADRAVPTRSWIQVTVKATANTGLAQDDVFYFGGAIGDADGNGVADQADMQAIFEEIPRTATVEDPLDIDRDGAIAYADMYATYLEIGQLPLLSMITVP